MKNITITPDQLTVSFGGSDHHFKCEHSRLVVTKAEVEVMPQGIKLIIILLNAAKKLSISAYYKDIREPIWKLINFKSGGLSEAGQTEFGNDCTVIEAAKEHSSLFNRSSSLENVEEKTTPDKPNPSVKSKQVGLRSQEGDEFDKDSRMFVQFVDANALKKNPLNSMIYDDKLNYGLESSVEQEGIKVPLRITSDLVLLDGHQRLACALQSGWKQVPVIFEKVPDSEHLNRILSYNRTRDKNNIEKLREFRAYFEIEKGRAPERSGTRTDLGSELPEGHTTFGKARDLAAKMVGISGSSGERGLKVLEEIEKREKDDQKNGVLEVKLALLKGINAGCKLAQAYGWTDSSIQPRNGSTDKSMHPLSNDPAPNLQNLTSDVTGNFFEWIPDVDILKLSKQRFLKEEDAEEMTSIIQLCTPQIHRITGATLDPARAEYLRHFGELLIELAERYEIRCYQE